MKKLFCFISLVILGLSLSSCKGDLKKVDFHGYKNSVKGQEFYEAFNKALEENEITCSVEDVFDMNTMSFASKIENEFEFEYTVEYFSNEEVTMDYNKPAGKTTSTEYQYDLIGVKADLDNLITYRETKSKDLGNDNGAESSSEEAQEIYYVIDKEDFLEVKPTYLSYKEFNTNYENPFKYAQSLLADEIIDMKSRFTSFNIESSDSIVCELYADKNLFTAIKTENHVEEDGEYSLDTTVCFKYQIKFSKDSIEFLYEHSSTVIDVNQYGTKKASAIDGKIFKVNKKDINLKAPSIEKYALN